MVWPDEIESDTMALHVKEWELLGFKVARQTGFVLILEHVKRVTTCKVSYSYSEEHDLWKGETFGESIKKICYEWDG